MSHRLRRTRFTRTLLLAAAGSAAVACAQTQAARPKFESVSIKPCPGGTSEGRFDASEGTLRLECPTLDRLIRMAYLSFPGGVPLPVSPTTGLPVLPISLRQYGAPIEGSPAWVSSERFTIEAKTAEPASRETMLGPMMQALLEDRFQLKIHREAREIPVYNLTVAEGGPKLQAAKEGSCIHLDLSIPAPPSPPGRPPPILCGAFRPSAKNDGLDVSGVTVGDLCSQFSVWLDRDAIDRTGIAGVFDIHLDVSAADLRGGDTFRALAGAVKKLGLKMEAGKGSGEFLVMDRVERPAK